MNIQQKFVSWRRVSTKKQGRSGLGLEAQADIIKYCVAHEKGELLADYCEVYTGTELSGCVELRKAIEHCKKEDAVLIIAKTDFFALAEREALLVSIRTRAALSAKKARHEPTGGTNELWGKITHASRKEAIDAATAASVAAKKERARQNPGNVAFKDFIEDWEAVHGPIGWQADWKSISAKLNSRGKRTASGMEYTPKRAQSMYKKMIKLYE